MTARRNPDREPELILGRPGGDERVAVTALEFLVDGSDDAVRRDVEQDRV
jgi:hypothetical protein